MKRLLHTSSLCTVSSTYWSVSVCLFGPTRPQPVTVHEALGPSLAWVWGRATVLTAWFCLILDRSWQEQGRDSETVTAALPWPPHYPGTLPLLCPPWSQDSMLGGASLPGEPEGQASSTCNNMMSFRMFCWSYSGWRMALSTGIYCWVLSTLLILWAPRTTIMDLQSKVS